MAIPSGACRWQGLLDVDLYSVEGRLWVIELTGLGPHGAFSTVREKRRGLHMDGLARCKLECAYGLYFGTARVRHLNRVSYITSLQPSDVQEMPLLSFDLRLPSMTPVGIVIRTLRG